MTPEEIAAGLTAAQRRAIKESIYQTFHWLLPADVHWKTLDALAQQGLAEEHEYWGLGQLTPLGLAVRAVIEKEEDDENNINGK